jgi:hypothetical protein
MFVSIRAPWSITYPKQLMANKLKYSHQFPLALAQEASKETSHPGLLRIGIPAPKCAYISGKRSAITLLEAGSVSATGRLQSTAE